MARVYKKVDHELHMRIGANMRKRRLKLEIKSKDAAEYVGVESTTYSNWEYGVGTPSYRNIQRLCDLYSCTIDSLFVEEVELDTIFPDGRRDLGTGKNPPKSIYRVANLEVANNSESGDGEEPGVQVEDPVSSSAG